MWLYFEIYNFKAICMIDMQSVSNEIALRWMSEELPINIVIAPWGSKSSPEPMLTKFYDAIWRHQRSMGQPNIAVSFDNSVDIAEYR